MGSFIGVTGSIGDKRTLFARNIAACVVDGPIGACHSGRPAVGQLAPSNFCSIPRWDRTKVAGIERGADVWMPASR
jgi:hypothetical protein